VLIRTFLRPQSASIYVERSYAFGSAGALPTSLARPTALFHILIRRLILERQWPVFIRVFVELLQAMFAAERNRLALVLRVNRFSNVAYLITGDRADRVYRFLGVFCGWRRACAR
jgi:hypothetical protein